MEKIKFFKFIFVVLHISRSEQAPGSEFHPHDKTEENKIGVFWYFLGAIKIYILKHRFHVVHMNYFRAM